MPKTNEICKSVKYSSTLATCTHETGELVSIQNNQVVTTSLVVSQIFDKRHSDVLRQIQKMILANAKVRRLFVSSNYIDEQGKDRVMFVMNRDGFCLLAMGFTGTKALEFKLAYINAFNEMEKRLAGATIKENEIVAYLRSLCEELDRKIKEHDKQLQKQFKSSPNPAIISPSLSCSEDLKAKLKELFAIFNNDIQFGMFAWARLESLEKEYKRIRKALAGMANDFLTYY